MTINNVTNNLVNHFQVEQEVKNRLNSVHFPEKNAKSGSDNLILKKTWSKELPKCLIEGALLVGFIALAILFHTTPMGLFLDLFLFAGFMSIGVDLIQRIRNVNKEFELISPKLLQNVKTHDDLLLKLLLWRRDSSFTKFNKKWEDSTRSERKMFVDLILEKIGLDLQDAIKFLQLDERRLNLLDGYIYEEHGSPQTDDIEWGKNNRFLDLAKFKSALQRIN